MIKLIKNYLFENNKSFADKNIAVYTIVDKGDFFTFDLSNQKFIMRFTIHKNDYFDYEKIDKVSGVAFDYQSNFFDEKNQLDILTEIKKQIAIVFNFQ